MSFSNQTLPSSQAPSSSSEDNLVVIVLAHDINGAVAVLCRTGQDAARLPAAPLPSGVLPTAFACRVLREQTGLRVADINLIPLPLPNHPDTLVFYAPDASGPVRADPGVGRAFWSPWPGLLESPDPTIPLAIAEALTALSPSLRRLVFERPRHQ